MFAVATDLQIQLPKSKQSLHPHLTKPATNGGNEPKPANSSPTKTAFQKGSICDHVLARLQLNGLAYEF